MRFDSIFRIVPLRQPVLVLCIAFVAVGLSCKTAARKPARRQAVIRTANVLPLVVRAMERAGGEDIWIKSRSFHPSPGTVPPTRPTAVAVVASRAHAAVLEAIQRQASDRKFQAHFQPLPATGTDRSTLIQIDTGRKHLCTIRLVEVPRILQAAIIIDDLGQNLAAAHQLAGLHYPLTFSIMPRVRYTRQIAELARASGHEVMLHLPMQPLPSSHARVSAHEIRAGMSRSDAERTVEQDLSLVPFVAGVNNHMGSQATADPVLMQAVMTVLASRRLFFIDSRTTADSVALDVARRMGVPAFYRSVFLDDSQNENYTLGQLRLFCDAVKRHGAAIAIGHPYPTTLAALGRFLPEFDREEIELVPASRLARSPEFARLSPPHIRH